MARRTVIERKAARIGIVLAVVTLAGAWLTQLAGQPVLGMTQQHFFNDAMALALLSIALLLDASAGGP